METEKTWTTRKIVLNMAVKDLNGFWPHMWRAKNKITVNISLVEGSVLMSRVLFNHTFTTACVTQP